MVNAAPKTFAPYVYFTSGLESGIFDLFLIIPLAQGTRVVFDAPEHNEDKQLTKIVGRIEDHAESDLEYASKHFNLQPKVDDWNIDSPTARIRIEILRSEAGILLDTEVLYQKADQARLNLSLLSDEIAFNCPYLFHEARSNGEITEYKAHIFLYPQKYQKLDEHLRMMVSPKVGVREMILILVESDLPGEEIWIESQPYYVNNSNNGCCSVICYLDDNLEHALSFLESQPGDINLKLLDTVPYELIQELEKEKGVYRGQVEKKKKKTAAQTQNRPANANGNPVVEEKPIA